LAQIEENIKNEKRALLELYKAGGHPNIIEVFQHGTFSTGPWYYFDMELCAMNLKEYMSQEYPKSLPLVEVCRIVREVTEGVVHLHRANLAHRDIKPQNGISFCFNFSITDRF